MNCGRYHLQALRHLYVLAAQPRSLVAVDADTLKPVFVPITLTMRDHMDKPLARRDGGGGGGSEDDDTAAGSTLADTLGAPSLSTSSACSTVCMVAPCLVSVDLRRVSKLTVASDRYFPVSLDPAEHRSHALALASLRVVVKRRPGAASHASDPEGLRSALQKAKGGGGEALVLGSGAGAPAEASPAEAWPSNLTEDPALAALAAHLSSLAAAVDPCASAFAADALTAVRRSVHSATADALAAGLEFSAEASSLSSGLSSSLSTALAFAARAAVAFHRQLAAVHVATEHDPAAMTALLPVVSAGAVARLEAALHRAVLGATSGDAQGNAGHGFDLGGRPLVDREGVRVGCASPLGHYLRTGTFAFPEQAARAQVWAQAFDAQCSRFCFWLDLNGFPAPHQMEPSPSGTSPSGPGPVPSVVRLARALPCAPPASLAAARRELVAAQAAIREF